MKVEKCICGGNALVKFEGNIIVIECDECGNGTAADRKQGETERQHMKRVVDWWNEDQKK